MQVNNQVSNVSLLFHVTKVTVNGFQTISLKNDCFFNAGYSDCLTQYYPSFKNAQDLYYPRANKLAQDSCYYIQAHNSFVLGATEWKSLPNHSAGSGASNNV